MGMRSCMPVAAPVAQRTEHRSSEPSVGGSIPSGSAWLGDAHWSHVSCQCAFIFSLMSCNSLLGIITLPQRARDAA